MLMYNGHVFIIVRCIYMTHKPCLYNYYVQVSVVADAHNATGSMHDYPRVPECTLSSDLGGLQDRGTFSDVTLSVGDAGERVFKAHKALLAARSPVFAAMFEHSMEESLKVSALFCQLVYWETWEPSTS